MLHMYSNQRRRCTPVAAVLAGSVLPQAAAAAAAECMSSALDAAAALLSTAAAGGAGGDSAATQLADAAAAWDLLLRHSPPHALWETADAATAAGDATAAAANAAVTQDWLTPVADGLESVLRTLQSGLESLHVPYSFGWSIIALTALVKLATFPFTKIQVSHMRGVICYHRFSACTHCTHCAQRW